MPVNNHSPGLIFCRREGREERHRTPCLMPRIFPPGQQCGAGASVLPNVHIWLWVLQEDICSTISSTCQPWRFRDIFSISRGVFFFFFSYKSLSDKSTDSCWDCRKLAVLARGCYLRKTFCWGLVDNMVSCAHLFHTRVLKIIPFSWKCIFT